MLWLRLLEAERARTQAKNTPALPLTLSLFQPLLARTRLPFVLALAGRGINEVEELRGHERRRAR